MLNIIKKSNVVNNIQKTFRHKAFDNFGSKVVSAISALAIINASAYSGQIGAQTQATFEEVVVTARKKEEGLQSVPLSVSALGEETLEEKVQNLLKQNVPHPLIKTAKMVETTN